MKHTRAQTTKSACFDFGQFDFGQLAEVEMAEVEHPRPTYPTETSFQDVALSWRHCAMDSGADTQQSVAPTTPRLLSLLRKRRPSSVESHEPALWKMFVCGVTMLGCSASSSFRQMTRVSA